MGRAPATIVVLIAAASIASCGGGDSDEPKRSPARSSGSAGAETTPRTRPPAADAAAVRVIKGWTDTLRRGDVAGASRYFAVPSIVQNGTDAIRLRTREEVEFFNRTLPCGAVLVRTERLGSYTVATFRLTERPGAGTCGEGTGDEAEVAFSVRGGHIVQWRRLETAPRDGVPDASSRSV